MLKRSTLGKIFQILSLVLICLIVGNTLTFAGGKDFSIFNYDYFANLLTVNRSSKAEFLEYAFIEDEGYFGSNGKYFESLVSPNQISQAEFETISLKNPSNTQSQNVNLSAAHKYLGYATALLAGITAVTFSFEGFHEIAGYTTAGLSLVTTGIGFYEYGEYFDLEEGFSGYNMHMIFETAATIGFVAAAALQDEEGIHAAIGGVSTAMMILPIFVVHW